MRYERQPEHDRRVARGDDFTGDAWLDTESGETVYGVAGYDMNRMQADTEEEAAYADWEKSVMYGH